MFAADYILSQLAAHGYLALFLITIVEGPLATILGGFFVSIGVFNFYLTFFLLYVADTIGDLLSYTIGYIGRERFANKLLGWLKIEEDKLLGLDDFFHRHGGKTIFIAKFVTGAGSWTLISAGMGRMKLTRFLKYSLGAGALKTLVYMGLGYFFGHVYQLLLNWMNLTSAIIIIAIILIATMIIVKRFLKDKFSYIFRNHKKR